MNEKIELPVRMMLEKQSFTKWSGKSFAASLTIVGKSKDLYIISGARYNSDVNVTSVSSSRLRLSRWDWIKIVSPLKPKASS